jgi:hypothetical protein
MGVKQDQREDLKLMFQVFWNVTLFQLVKGDWSEKNNASTFSIKQFKENGFFINIVLLCSR